MPDFGRGNTWGEIYKGGCMKILVTGFDPFGKFSINSSERAVSLLPKALGGNEIITVILPVSYTRSEKQLLDCMRSVRPDAVVCVGQNALSAEIRVESTAGNYAHAEEEDADHNLWLYRSIDMSGAPSYRSTLPIEAMVRNIKHAGIAAEVSHSAGTFVCNCLMYQALRACETEFAGTLCGFVHVPVLPEQCSDPSTQPNMPLEKISEALRIALATVIDPAGDGVIAAEVAGDVAAAETAAGTSEVAGDVVAAETAAAGTADGAVASMNHAGDRTAVVADNRASAVDTDDDDDDFSMAAGVTPEMLAAINDDDDDFGPVERPNHTTVRTTAGHKEASENAANTAGSPMTTPIVAENAPEQEATGETSVTAETEADSASADAPKTESAEAAEEAGTVPADAPKTASAASAAVAYFSKAKKEKVLRDREEISASEVYYGGQKKAAQPSEARTGEVLKRISGSVPERITTSSEEPRETLFEPARERMTIDTKDYRVFSVDSKYRGSGEATEQMTLTEFMDEFIPERQKTEQELREEAARTLIHEGEVRDPRTYRERVALREEAKRKEDAKEHIAYGDLYVMSETMRAMGKTVNKSVLVDDDIHQLLYTALEDGGDIWAYHIVKLDNKGNITSRVIGELPVYAKEYERYYLFCALTGDKKIVCDPETYEIRLEDL